MQKKKTAVMYGAGNIGRGFIGQVLHDSGYEVAFVDVDQNLIDAFNQTGSYVITVVEGDRAEEKVIGDVRGMGAMIGLEFVKDKKTKEPNGELVSAIVQECAKNGLMVENSGRWGQVIRFLAPLVITDEQLECGLNILEKAIQTCLK